MDDLTVVYYTCNYLEDKNPYFLENTRRQLLKVIGNTPLIISSQKPTNFGGNSSNICIGEIGRSHLNLYKQILIGVRAAKTEWVAMAEDDILYSESHFNPQYFVRPETLKRQMFFYDMNKVSLFSWSKPPMFSFRTKRKVVNQLIAHRQMLIDALEERFNKLETLRKVKSEEQILKHWGDPGRYENYLGFTVRETYEWYSWVPSIVFSHEHAFGYLNQGKKKKMGDLRIIELADWGRAEDILKLYEKNI